MRVLPVAVPLLAFVMAACTGRPAGEPASSSTRPATRQEPAVTLPAMAGAWRRPASPRRVDEASIFSYMDGGGELYLGYRFDHLDAYEYTAPGRDPILVEIYSMRSSDDAFGLLSNDWGGEAIDLGPASGERGSGPPVPPARALYGAGLLRLWSDNLYARVLANRETPESREQVLALGRAIVAGRRVTPPPSLLDILPEQAGPAFRVRRDRVTFLRSHLVLNSAYFLSSQNILDLSPSSSEAALAAYERATTATPGGKSQREQLLVVRYQDAVTARRAFDHFLAAYLPEARPPASGAGALVDGTQRIEHGLVGYHLDGALLILALDAPDEGAARSLLEASARRSGR